MNNVEFYINLFEFLKKILEFYGDESIYEIDSTGNSKIKNDKYGSLARFGLKKIKELENNYNNINNEIDNKINNIVNKNDDIKIYEDFLKIIENLNNL